MERRAFLSTAVAAGCTALAGCSGGDGDDDGEASNATDEGDGTDVAARIDAAITELEANDGEFDAFDDEESPDTFPTSTVHDRADVAETELDAAGGDADADQQEAIETLRATATFQRETADYAELQVEFEHCMDAADSYIENDEWGSASDEIGECRTTLSELNDQYDEVIDALDDVDTERLASETAIAYDDPDEELRLAADELDALVEYVDGFERFVDGVDRWQAADESIQQEEWTAAAADFEDARAEFEASATTLRELEDDSRTPGSIRPDVIDLRCNAEAFAEASDEMAKGCEAADRGDNSGAEEHFDAAETALERCE